MKTTATGHIVTKNGKYIKQPGEIIKTIYMGACIKEGGFYYYYTGKRLGKFIYAI